MTLRSLLMRLDEPVDRRTYLTAGLVLTPIKYAVDASIIYASTWILWTPLDYVAPLLSVSGAKVAQFSPGLSFVLLLFALPFIWIGITLSVRRAEDAGVSPWWVVAFFLPILNYVLMAVLATLPTRHTRVVTRDTAFGPARSPGMAVLLGVLAGTGTGVLLTLAAFRGGSYGLTIFLCTPFLIGAVAAFVCSRSGGMEAYRSLLAAFISLGACGVALTLFAIEGVVCIVMAIPIALPIVLLGAIVGQYLGRRPSTTYAGMILVFALVPAGSAIEHAHAGETAVPRLVTTVIEVNATPEQVWPFVVSFEEITEPPQWYFRSGLAYPLRARILGSGVGAVRFCEFTTGGFREPITAWDAPHRLAFDVADHPPPLTELSPYSRIYSRHLDGYFRTERGEFRLIELAGGRTRLEGHSWYTLKMAPALYWNSIADRILHDIHRRVLAHIKVTAERAVAGGG
jgi:uncharacterized membrane protein YhaH (DUF805 family)